MIAARHLSHDTEEGAREKEEEAVRSVATALKHMHLLRRLPFQYGTCQLLISKTTHANIPTSPNGQ